MHMAIVWLIIGLICGFTLKKKIQVDKKSNLIERNGVFLGLNIGEIHFSISYLLMWTLSLFIIFYLILGELTYGIYIGSWLGFISVITFFLFFTGIIDIIKQNNLKPRDNYQDTNIEKKGFDSKFTFRFASIKIFICIILVIFLLTTIIRPLSGNCDYNPVFKQLNDSEKNTKDCEISIINSGEIRLVSWQLATEYLERGYSGIASSMSTDQIDLDENSDPSFVNGKFLWINAPQYESLKWFGSKTIPFYLYVENTPEGSKALTKVNKTFEIHKSRITWNNRISEVLFDRYGLKYVNIQSRFTVDDEYNPYWVVYLGERHVHHDKVTLKKILLIDATNIKNLDEYSVNDKNIPKWLDVVFPNKYIEDWSDHWGKWRNGIKYKWFDKKHLYYRDDFARFLIINSSTYWYVPMRQLDSNVLGGYILQNTRTGETTFYNREEKSFCSRITAKTQVEKYLQSGIVGYRKLRIDEGYLYPIKMDDNITREAYIFPLYAGYTVQQFAIVDAQFYTIIPFISEDLNGLLNMYKAYNFGDVTEVNLSIKWDNISIERGYIDDSESVLVADNITYLVNKTQLGSGDIEDEENEWRELKLAISDFERGEEVFLWIGKVNNDIYDIDYLKADLVKRD